MFYRISTLIALTLFLGCAKFETINRADELVYRVKSFSAIDTINFINESDTVFTSSHKAIYDRTTTPPSYYIQYNPDTICSAYVEVDSIISPGISGQSDFIFEFEINIIKMDSGASLYFGFFDSAMTLESRNYMICYYQYKDTNLVIGIVINDGDSEYNFMDTISRKAVIDSRSRISIEYNNDTHSLIFREGAVLNHGRTRIQLTRSMDLNNLRLDRLGFTNKGTSRGLLRAKLKWIVLCR